MDYKNIKLELFDDYAILTIDRPSALNALNPETVSELNMAYLELEKHVNIRSVILTGGGEKSFVAGADIKAMSNLTTREAYKFAMEGQKLGLNINESDKVYIAAVNGFALGGGCELALACDFAYASEKAKFGQPEVGLGVIPGFGGTQRLTRVIGMARTKELVYTGDIIKADEALRLGIINKIFTPETLMEEAIKTAKKIAKNAPIAVAYSKKVINKGLSMDMAQAVELESQTFASLFGTKDQKEGMTAFMEKRKADFKGE
jgi:enoyl-CoA hydratase